MLIAAHTNSRLKHDDDPRFTMKSSFHLRSHLNHARLCDVRESLIPCRPVIQCCPSEWSHSTSLYKVPKPLLDPTRIHIHLCTTRKRTKSAMMSTSKPKHIPPRIKREDFQSGHMKPNSYSLEDISAAIIDHLSRSKDEFTVKQLEGLAKFKYHGT
jgi:hypothetical protein